MMDHGLDNDETEEGRNKDETETSLPDDADATFRMSASYSQSTGSSMKLSKNSWTKLKEDFVSEMRILSKLRHPW